MLSDDQRRRVLDLIAAARRDELAARGSLDAVETEAANLVEAAARLAADPHKARAEMESEEFYTLVRKAAGIAAVLGLHQRAKVTREIREAFLNGCPIEEL